MNWKDILEIGPKEDASPRNEDASESEVQGPEVWTGSGRSPAIAVAPPDRPRRAESLAPNADEKADRRHSEADRRHVAVDRRRTVMQQVPGREQAAAEAAATSEGMPEPAGGKGFSPAHADPHSVQR